ncbi:tape measure protein [Phascolarctobacterium faecium]|uniref:Tape measure protein n=1 Tax=Phascolarctobacterium faecium TaxID=33025 RepID=A0A7X2XHJ9_9FIRM|nr:tape measure protein [Phascolarctobacterium faecium]KAA3379881.1 tape measure protein [Akkermansia muciniphila]MTS82154.1 tape measure protein [Phascolarctobacterium faecium]MTT03392.1 tape measure protein [Phascolarctobacterium faecium]MTT17463.1 tape measure protein [Phascolarctobacterium faecium]MTT35595.1 tape measure protein [Phascolarctobacterium faecium]
MADIHNSIILDDRMSKPIADINAHMLELKKSMEKTNTMLESMAGKMGGVKTKSIALGSAIGNMAGNLATKLAELPGQALRMGDTLMSMRARIDNINDGMQTTDELMEKVYQSSMRSRSAYVDTAAVVAKLGLNAADAFGNFDEIVGFAETMNKAFVVSGASASEMQAGMYQLTQAMASGRLQGDEFRSISENAPMLANAIAKFTGKSRGELKQMSSDGEITADVIKKALTFAADDIEAKFKNMPITFMQSLTRMENKAIRFFSDDLTSVSHVAAKGIMFVSENMYELAIASAYVGTVAAAYFAPALYSAAGAAWTAAAGFAAANWPLLVGVGILFALAGAMLEFPELAGTVAGAFAAMGSGIYNVLVGILNFWKVVINAIISGINVIRKFNAERLGQKYVAIEMMQMTDMKDPNEAFKEGKTWGTEAAKNLGERLDKLKKGIMDPQNRNTSPTQNENKDNNVDKVKSVGKVKDPIKIDDESLKLIRDVAMKKYQVNFKTVQPVFRLSFGDIRETIDIDKAVERVEARIVDLYNSNLVVPNNG